MSFSILTAASGNTTASLLTTLLPFVVLIVVFYFLLIRPENKKKKALSEMRDSLSVGDEVTTIGGIVGKVVHIKDDLVTIETSEDRVRIEFLKSAIGQVGTLDEQAAAMQRGGKKAKKEEAPAEVEAPKAEESVEETVAEEKTEE